MVRLASSFDFALVSFEVSLSLSKENESKGLCSREQSITDVRDWVK